MHEIMRMVEVLPAPLGPRNPNASPRCDGEVDAVDRGEVAEALGEPARLDHRRDAGTGRAPGGGGTRLRHTATLATGADTFPEPDISGCGLL